MNDAERAFLKGLWSNTFGDAPSPASIDHYEYGPVARVGFVSGHGEVQFTPQAAARLLVTAAHEWATWQGVVEAAKEYAGALHQFKNGRWSRDAALGAKGRLFAAIDAALKQGSDA